ncbi:MAG TPA: FkbM family methyltransferase [Thermoanaerobaculia bacterium]
MRFAERVFLGVGRLSAALPRFRGKARAALALYKALGLAGRHVRVRARMRRPAPFDVELDLHAWLQRLAFVTGGYEAETVELLLALHEQSDGYLLDVGANVGFISIPFALRSKAPVVAVEAVPDNVAVLRRNVAANGLQSAITIVPLALGTAPGKVEIQVEGNLHPGDGTGTANILPDGSTYDCVRQELEITTLDLLDLPPRCGVVKLDTDGYDLKVLQGGVEFLARERPLIFGEFSAHCLAWHGQTADDVVAFARAQRYDVYGFDGAGDLLLVPVELRDSALEHRLHPFRIRAFAVDADDRLGA